MEQAANIRTGQQRGSSAVPLAGAGAAAAVELWGGSELLGN